MFLEKLDIIITIVASLAVSIVSLVIGVDLSELAFRLVITILIFYIMGFFMKMYLQGDVLKTPQDEEYAQNDGETVGIIPMETTLTGEDEETDDETK